VVIALNHSQTGAFAEALEALNAARALADSTGDPRLEIMVTWATGVLRAARGEGEAGVEACRRAVERAPDLMNRAITTGWLGFALLEHGEARPAIQQLQDAVERFERFGYRPLQAWFAAFLAEAYRLDGRSEPARRAAEESLAIALETAVPPAAGWAWLVLGRLANDAGRHAEAEGHLREALAVFTSTHSQYEIGRTQPDLAVAVHGQGRADEARAVLDSARRLLAALDLPRHAERAARLARTLGVAQ
jgi:tetratricopeptide (TPR) repeat protein